MRVSIVSVVAGLALVAAAGTAQAELVSKRYQFKSGVILEMGVSTTDGLRLDSVMFHMPPHASGKLVRTGGLPGAEIAISNISTGPLRAGLALALFDDEERLLGVAKGGNKIANIKPGRQKTFKIIFDGVNAQAHRASVFQVSLETKP